MVVNGKSGAWWWCAIAVCKDARAILFLPFPGFFHVPHLFFWEYIIHHENFWHDSIRRGYSQTMKKENFMRRWFLKTPASVPLSQELSPSLGAIFIDSKGWVEAPSSSTSRCPTLPTNVLRASLWNHRSVVALNLPTENQTIRSFQFCPKWNLGINDWSATLKWPKSGWRSLSYPEMRYILKGLLFPTSFNILPFLWPR